MNTVSVTSPIETAVELQRHGAYEQAEELYRQLLDVEPHNAAVLQYAGFLALQTGRFDVAVERLELARDHGSDEANTNLLLGRAYKGAGRIDAAISSYRRALLLDGTLVDAYVSLGVAYRANGQVDDAAWSYGRALNLDEKSFEACLNLANIRQAQGRLEEAIAHYAYATRLRPDSAELHLHFGTALIGLGRNSEAAEEFLQAITCDADLLDAYFNLGSVLNAMHQYEAAAEYFLALLARLETGAGHQQYSAARRQLLRDTRLGWIDALIGNFRYDEALPVIESALRESPDSVELLDRMLLIAPYRLTSQSALVALCERFQRVAQRAAPPAISPTAPIAPIAPNDATDKLRIGYVSGDLREHSVAYFLEPLLANHDKTRYEVFCYSSNPSDDAVTAQLRALTDAWIDAKSMSDQALAERISQDRIDVLIDLSGRTGGNRSATFVRRPASLQVAYLGYPTYSALREIEFRVTDLFIDPDRADAAELATERPLHLPQSMFCYRPPAAAPEVSAECADPGRPIRFGSFNQPPKLSPVIVNAWAEILRRVPDSALILKAFAFDDEPIRNRILDAFARAGIDAARVDIRTAEPSKERHFASYHDIDIALDTFPYNGATTTCEALWMGVPVVSLCGETHASRMGASLLNALQLEALVTDSVEDYVALAVTLAENAPWRSELRSTLRSRFERSSLRDELGFARAFEDAILRARESARSRN